jgi:hypothetical protein
MQGCPYRRTPPNCNCMPEEELGKIVYILPLPSPSPKNKNLRIIWCSAAWLDHGKLCPAWIWVMVCGMGRWENDGGRIGSHAWILPARTSKLHAGLFEFQLEYR